MKIIYVIVLLIIAGGCDNHNLKSQNVKVEFYENDRKIALISNDDILDINWNNFSFKLKTSKMKELDSIKIDGVSPSYAIISINNENKVKVGVCSSISSNCFPRTKSTYWYNYENKTLFENDKLVLHPPVSGKYEKEILDLQWYAASMKKNK